MNAWTAQKVKRLREAAGLTQAQLADWLGVTAKHVAHMEIGFRPAGPQTVRLLDILAERVKSGEWKARAASLERAVQPRRSRGKSKPAKRRVTR